MPDVFVMVLTAVVYFGAAFVERVCGFGSGIFAMLFLPYFLPNQTIGPAILGMISGVGCTYNAVKNRKHIHIRTMLPLIFAALIAIPIAVRFSAGLNARSMKMLLGVVLIVLSVYFLFFSKRVHIRPTVCNGVIAGALGGTLNGLFSTGGPPAVLYLVHATTDNLAYFGTIQAYFAVTSGYATIVRAIGGLITKEVLILFCCELVGWWFGNQLGGKIFDRLNSAKLRRIVYVAMIVSGVLMIL